MGRTAKSAVEEVITNTAEEKNEKSAKKTIEPLNDSDEVEVVSLIPNISYKDSRTGDFYEWDEKQKKHIDFLVTQKSYKNEKDFDSKNLVLRNQTFPIFDIWKFRDVQPRTLTPIQECAQHPTIRRNGIVRKPSHPHRYYHSLQIFAGQRIHWLMDIQMIGNAVKMIAIS